MHPFTTLLTALALAASVVNGLPLTIGARASNSTDVAAITAVAAVTVFSAQDLLGSSITLPASAVCENLAGGGWDQRIRSLVTVAGYRCDFYLNTDCVSKTEGDTLHYGWTTAKVLPERFDGSVRSVLCQSY